MIDIHSHLVFEVDDGSPSIKESIGMVLEAEKSGIKAIVATPHFHEDIYLTNKAAVNLNELAARTAGCGVDLYIGYEVFITPFLPDMVDGKVNLTLSGSRFLLFELPPDSVPVYSLEVIYKLILRGIVPVIAHPERNRSFIRNFNAFIGFIKGGCLVQVDTGSIIGVYGQEARNFVKKLVKMDMVHFIASDAHAPEDYAQWHRQAYRKVSNWAGAEYAARVFEKNPLSILCNTLDIV